MCHLFLWFCLFVSPKLCLQFDFGIYMYLDNSGSDSRNLIGQLQVSKRRRNLERTLSASGGDSKCPGHLESPPLALRIPPTGT